MHQMNVLWSKIYLLKYIFGHSEHLPIEFACAVLILVNVHNDRRVLLRDVAQTFPPYQDTCVGLFQYLIHVCHVIFAPTFLVLIVYIFLPFVINVAGGPDCCISGHCMQICLISDILV